MLKSFVFAYCLVLALGGWVGLLLGAYVVSSGRMPAPRGGEWWLVAFAAACALLGTWGAILARPRRGG